MEIIITPEGLVQCIYDETLDLTSLGQVTICRASHVEPTSNGAWTADLSPVNGPTLGPFTLRSQAIDAEIAWLKEHCFESSKQ